MKKGENIYKRKDGRWEGRYKDGYKANGKVHYRSVYAKSYSEVKTKLLEIKCKKQRPTITKKLNMNEVYNLYIESIQFNVKISTISNYSNLYHTHIGKHFGGYLIHKISNDMINEFITKKLSENLSSKFVSDIVCLLKSILNYATRQKWIQQQDYDIIKFKVTIKPIEVFTEDEVALIEQKIIETPILPYVGILLSLSMGLRIGEICALRINDIDLENRVIHIDKTLQRIKNPTPNAITKTIVIIDKPKSQASIRNVPIPYFLVLLLQKNLCTQSNNAFFLTGKADKFIEPRMLEKLYRQFLKSAGIIYRKFHTLRHTFATLAIRNGIFDIKTLSQLLGHSSIKITYKYYIHSDIATQKMQMQRLNDVYMSRHELRQNNTKILNIEASNTF